VLVVPFALNFIDAPLRTAERMNGFLAMAMCGDYCKLDEDVSANGPTASACSAAPWVVESDGSGTQKTMCGLKSIQNISDDGFTSMHAKRLGTALVCILKDGARRCHIALPSPSMERQM
jgi:hypothetical protein